MPRKPKSQADQKKPTILRGIRLDNGDVYGPGEEEEFLKALKGRAEAADEEHEAAAEQGAAPRAAALPTRFEHKDELERLTRNGSIVNFVDVDDDDEEEDVTHEKRADRAVVKELQEAPRRNRVRADTDQDSARERVKNRQKARLEEDDERESAKAPKTKGRAKDDTGADDSAGDPGGGGGGAE